MARRTGVEWMGRGWRRASASGVVLTDGGEDSLGAVAVAVRQRRRGGGPQGRVGVEPDHGHFGLEVGLAVGAASAASLATSRHL